MAADGTREEFIRVSFDAFSLRAPVPTPDQVRGHASLENAMDNKKGRREAGLFADISAQAEIDLGT
jgi:hypothetical protein